MRRSGDVCMGRCVCWLQKVHDDAIHRRWRRWWWWWQCWWLTFCFATSLVSLTVHTLEREYRIPYLNDYSGIWVIFPIPKACVLFGRCSYFRHQNVAVNELCSFSVKRASDIFSLNHSSLQVHLTHEVQVQVQVFIDTLAAQRPNNLIKQEKV